MNLVPFCEKSTRSPSAELKPSRQISNFITQQAIFGVVKFFSFFPNFAVTSGCSFQMIPILAPSASLRIELHHAVHEEAELSREMVGNSERDSLFPHLDIYSLLPPHRLDIRRIDSNKQYAVRRNRRSRRPSARAQRKRETVSR